MNKKINWSQFIDFWKQFYNHGSYLDEIYYIYINNLSHPSSLNKLWRWKMGVYFHKKSNQKALKLMEEKKDIIISFRNSNPTFNQLYNMSYKRNNGEKPTDWYRSSYSN